MRLFEYQAKALLAENGITVPESMLVRNSRSAGQAAEATSKAVGALLERCSAVVVKAQLRMGGRGKAGLVKKVFSPAMAAQEAALMYEGEFHVKTVLVEEVVSVGRELYFSISPDPVSARYMLMACSQGGVEIEQIACEQPSAIRKVFINPEKNLQSYQARSLAYDLGVQGDEAKRLTDVIMRLYELFRQKDAELVEINPLFVTTGGEVIAGDAKISVDDNSLFRHPDFKLLPEYFDSPVEYEAALEGIPYLQFHGAISLMCAGAGLTTSVFDLVHFEGGTVANYLEFGGPNYRRARQAMELCLKNDSAVILIVTFGTIARADIMAQGIVDALSELKPDRPIVTCIRGTN